MAHNVVGIFTYLSQRAPAMFTFASRCSM